MNLSGVISIKLENGVIDIHRLMVHPKTSGFLKTEEKRIADRLSLTSFKKTIR
jgi:hypothetical protein